MKKTNKTKKKKETTRQKLVSSGFMCVYEYAVHNAFVKRITNSLQAKHHQIKQKNFQVPRIVLMYSLLRVRFRSLTTTKIENGAIQIHRIVHFSPLSLSMSLSVAFYLLSLSLSHTQTLSTVLSSTKSLLLSFFVHHTLPILVRTPNGLRNYHY